MNRSSVLGYDRITQSWVEDVSGPDVATLPRLDGTILLDDASLGRAADDFGHLVHHQPIALLAPQTSEDVVKMVDFARENGLKISPRGQAFNGSGLAQAEGGIVVKMSELNGPPMICEGSIEVGAGMTWREVVVTTLEQGLKPPVLSQALYLSVGGTLSVSGFDGSSFRYGAQVENVLELTVVTGEGRLETCSAIRLPELFNSVLAGLGQCGIILRVTLPLIHAHSHVRTFELLYPDLPTMLADEHSLITDGRFDGALGFALPSASGGWHFHLRADTYYSPPDFPDNEVILSGLHNIRGFEQITDLTYLDCMARGPGHGVGYWYRGRVKMPHPFFGVLLPDSTINRFAEEMLSGIRPSSAEPDFVIEFYRVNASLRSRPLYKLPEGESVFLVVFLSSHSNPEKISEILQRGRRFFDLAHSLGGTWIPSSSIPLSKKDWQDHFGSAWEGFVNAKRRFDPDNVLTPGPGIF